MSQLEIQAGTRLLLRGGRHDIGALRSKTNVSLPTGPQTLGEWASVIDNPTFAFDRSINLLDLEEATNRATEATDDSLSLESIELSTKYAFKILTESTASNSLAATRHNLLEDVYSSGTSLVSATSRYFFLLTSSQTIGHALSGQGPSLLTKARDERLARLRAFGRMIDGWDGADAKPLYAASIDQARAFINGLARRLGELRPGAESLLPDIDPSPEGFITLYWSRPSFLLTCDFKGDGQVEWLAEIDDGEFEDSESLGDEWRLPPRLLALIEQYALTDVE